MSSSSVTSGPAVLGRGMLLRAAGAILVGLACLALVRDRFADLTLPDLADAAASIGPASLALALGLGVVSHLALSGYDMLALSRLRRYVPWRRALAGGFAGTVIAQVLGFGLVTGSLARGRIYRANGLRAVEIATLSGLVTAGFFAGVGVSLVLLLCLDPSPAARAFGADAGFVRLAALVVLVLIGATIAGSRRMPERLRILSIEVRRPDAAWLCKATGLALADTVPAALCLAVLLPGEMLPSIPSFVAIYLMALTLGHVANLPGGVGPFEAILLLALPDVPIEVMTVAILTYRAIYYGPPLLLAVVLLLRARKTPGAELLSPDAVVDRVQWTRDEADQAEAALVELGDKHVYAPADCQAFAMYGIGEGSWLMLGDPIGPVEEWSKVIRGLNEEARAAGARLAGYKTTERSREIWIAAGFRVQSLGEEGVLDVGGFDIAGRERRELRRKCRAAEKAGVTVEVFEPGSAPLGEMAGVAAAWCDAKDGPELSFSMGHWDPQFNSRHVAVVARLQGRVIAFITLWTSGDGTEWMLDLMRNAPGAPSGTMHRLVAAAIDAARERGAERFNLCAAPLSGLNREGETSLVSRIGHHFYEKYEARHGLQGLRRFKEMYRPRWSMRSVAAEGPVAMVEALWTAHLLVSRKSSHDIKGFDRVIAFPAPTRPLVVPVEPNVTSAAALAA